MSNSQEPWDIWAKLPRRDLEQLLLQHAYTPLHLLVLYWLIWLSLLSDEELLRLLSLDKERRVETKAELTGELTAMKELGLIDTVALREPPRSLQRLYYATDLGLYLYLSAVHPSPPLTPSRLVKAYPVGREDLLTRLARPQIHLALSDLATRLIVEGTPLGYHLLSYQQPWHHAFTLAGRRQVLISDAALLTQHNASTPYAFLIHVDTGPHHRADRHVEHFLASLLSLRQRMALSRKSWPALLILSTPDRLSAWMHLLLESSVKRGTKPLSGGMTTLEAMREGVYSSIWWDLVTLTQAQDAEHLPRLPFSALLHEPASEALVEQFSQQCRFYEILLKEAALPPPRLQTHLTRYVGDSLSREAAQFSRAQLETLFARKRKNRSSLQGAGLLNIALTAREKDLLSLASHHPLLDVPTFQALLHPKAHEYAIKPLQATITHLFQQGLIETRLWPQGKTPLEQQRYLLTPITLKFLAIRQGEPFSFYLVHPKYQRGDDEQLDRQWGTRGLDRQMGHTNALYTFMHKLIRGTAERGEGHLNWSSAHEAARWYRDSLSHESGHARPDAELVFVPAGGGADQTLLLEYDRGTSTYQYQRKFTAYLDYQQATGITLPLILLVTPTQRSAQRIGRVLDALPGALPIVYLLEHELLTRGLTFALSRFPASSLVKAPSLEQSERLLKGEPLNDPL